MTPARFFGLVPPYFDVSEYAGKLIVIEGTDGVGRTTQITALKEWLEVRGHAVIETGLARSELVGETIDEAKRGHEMNRLTMSLLYATDFADRLEKEIIPALRAGFIVLSDRYLFTAIARAKVRGVEDDWVRDLFGFGIMPDLVFYLKADVRTALRRVLASGVIDYWEAGRDLHPELDTFDSFVAYQTELLREFDRLAIEFDFKIVDARLPVDEVQSILRDEVERIVQSPADADETGVIRARESAAPPGAGTEGAPGPARGGSLGG